MVFSRRILSLVIVPLMSLAIFRLYSRETFLAFQDAIHRSATDTLLGRILPRSLPPRSEIPLYVTSQTHWSHIEKVTAIALGLAELGYPVTFITGRVFEDYVTSLHPNIKFSAMLGLDDKMSEKDMATYMSLPSGVDQEIFIMKKVLVDGTDDGHDTLQAQFREFRTKYGNHKPLISLYDQTCSGHFPILLGSPGIRPDASIGISLAPLAIDSNDTFPFMSGKPPYPGPNAQEVHNRAYKDRFESRLTRELNEYWWAKLKVLGVERESYPVMTNAMNAIPDYLLTLGIPQFEFPRSDLRPNVRYFGAFRKVGKSGEEPKLPDWWHDLVLAKEQGKKIIAVSQGTVEVRPEDLVLPTLEALKDDEDVLVVATFVVTEPEEVPGLVVPENARVAKFVPYDQLLPMVGKFLGTLTFRPDKI